MSNMDLNKSMFMRSAISIPFILSLLSACTEPAVIDWQTCHHLRNVFNLNNHKSAKKPYECQFSLVVREKYVKAKFKE